jgi:hypothetical protein
MDPRHYFESVGLEFNALHNRVRQLIDGAHWQTHGEWQESVLRQMLRRHLPTNAVVGRGFVISAEGATSQLDVLVYDDSKPVLFRDGDLAFVTPDAVIGIIEVKARLNAAEFGEAAEKLARDIELIRLPGNSDAFAGLFAYEANGENLGLYLERLRAAANNWNQRIDIATIGHSMFLKYWHLDPQTDRRMYERWHAYRMPGLATGYFIHNIVDFVAPDSVAPNARVWFPQVGKEQFLEENAISLWHQAAPDRPRPTERRTRPRRVR